LQGLVRKVNHPYPYSNNTKVNDPNNNNSTKVSNLNNNNTKVNDPGCCLPVWGFEKIKIKYRNIASPSDLTAG
jgi:hypothetical protein